MMGLGQAVAILVGQRLGADRPDLAERSVYTGLSWTFGYMCTVAAVYLSPRSPGRTLRGGRDPDEFRGGRRDRPVAVGLRGRLFAGRCGQLDVLLRLRGAGDTRFVSLLTFALAWPIMVMPTFLVVRAGGNLYWAWGFAHRVHHRDGRLFHPAVPQRPVEIDAVIEAPAVEDAATPR